MSNQSTVSSYQYNGLGDRLSQTVNAQTTNYTLDLNAGLTQVLNDGTNSYLYGNGRIAQTAGATTEYFLGDALGSVRQLTDAQGDITLANAYEPYGTLAQSAGGAQTSYGFTGEFTDPSGMVYLRARYYMPNDGRFLTRDTWIGDYNSPLSLNRWMYVEGNPIMYVDNTGLSGSSSLAIFAIPFQSHLPGNGLEKTSWTETEKRLIDIALWNISSAYARAYNFYHPEMDCLISNGVPPEVAYKLLGMQYRQIDPITAFLRIHGGKVTFYKHAHRRFDPIKGEEDNTWGMGTNYNTVNIFSVGEYTIDRFGKDNEALVAGNYIRFITHEMGHVFDHAINNGNPPPYKLGRGAVPSELVVCMISNLT